MTELILNTVLIEDSNVEMELLKEILKDFKEIRILGSADKVTTGVNLITNFKPDVIFLDVQLVDKTGFDLLDKIKEYNLSPFIVFTTSHTDFAIDAIQYSATDYLVKPLNKKKIEKSIKKIKETIATRTNIYSQNKLSDYDKIAVQTQTKTQLIDIEQIMYLETIKGFRLTKFHFIGGKELTAVKSIGDFEKDLLAKKFEKINRFLTINPKHVTALNKEGIIEFKENKYVEVSKRSLRDLMRKLNIIE
ncbi:MAG: response regulator transcription factor [Bacteroidales bacterium]|nr:response regulator transcription factor [Bacteroidales bacterium]